MFASLHVLTWMKNTFNGKRSRLLFVTGCFDEVPTLSKARAKSLSEASELGSSLRAKTKCLKAALAAPGSRI